MRTIASTDVEVTARPVSGISISVATPRKVNEPKALRAIVPIMASLRPMRPAYSRAEFISDAVVHGGQVRSLL
jgi:hypothetical protein